MVRDLLKKILTEKQKNLLKQIIVLMPRYNNKCKILNLENVKIKTSYDTLEKIKSIILNGQKGCYIRFGDGDIFLLKNIGQHRNQSHNIKLIQELREAISINADNAIKSLAINSKKFGIEEYMEYGIHEVPNFQAEKILLNTYEFFIGNQIYSPVALHYQIVYNKQYAIEFLRMLRSFHPTFVGSEQNSPEILKSVLDSTDIVQTLHRNTYEQIDKLENQIVELLKKRNLDYDIVVFSCGATAKALIKRIYLNYNKPVFLFDMGSVIDLFHGRTQWTWVKKAGIDSSYLDSIVEALSESK